MLRRIDFKSTWERLEETVERVLLSLPLERAIWNERFSDVYSICIAYPETLNDDLYKATQALLTCHVQKIKDEIHSSGPDLLCLYSKHWTVYNQGAKYLDLLYHHFNQQYIRKSRHSDADIEYGYSFHNQKQMLEIGELALETWKEIVIEPLTNELVPCVLSEILKHRNGFPANENDSRVFINSLVVVEEYKKKNALKFYEDTFEKPFLQQTGEFYREKASDLLMGSSCSDYMKQVLLLLTEEELRNRKFLHQTSYKKVTTECQQRVIFDHVQFLQTGCRDMIRKDARDDLLHMFLLLKNAPEGLTQMVYELEEHIKETGRELIKGLGEGNIPLQFVETVLQLHKRFSALVNDLFHGDKHFVNALNRACTSIVNYNEPKQPCRAPELVSRYCDSILRRCSKGSTDEADDKLKASITVFRYIDDKDVFQKFYSRALAKRLINNTCSMEMEEHMINRFKDVCGYDFTSKLHSMFTDVRMSTEHTKKFHESLSRDELANINMNANILQAGAWPLNSTQQDFMLPECLLKCVQKFEHFYNKQFNGRNLSWLHHLSQAEVRMQTFNKSYVITTSIYQLSILLLFNEADELTYEDFTSSTLLTGKDLERNVAALVDSKILLKKLSAHEKGGVPSFVCNDSMVNKRTRFKVMSAATQREHAVEVQQTHSNVEEDRKLYLQAAIVRIMKDRKNLRHNVLMEEVIMTSRARFAPSVSAIKRSIEALIEKSYIERSPNAPDTYRYLA